jgi:hypothetical protein
MRINIVSARKVCYHSYPSTFVNYFTLICSDDSQLSSQALVLLVAIPPNMSRSDREAAEAALLHAFTPGPYFLELPAMEATTVIDIIPALRKQIGVNSDFAIMFHPRVMATPARPVTEFLHKINPRDDTMVPDPAYPNDIVPVPYAVLQVS